jgi:hypothetical protein
VLPAPDKGQQPLAFPQVAAAKARISGRPRRLQPSLVFHLTRASGSYLQATQFVRGSSARLCCISTFAGMTRQEHQVSF